MQLKLVRTHQIEPNEPLCHFKRKKFALSYTNLFFCFKL